jgi:hypothetical protein
VNLARWLLDDLQLSEREALRTLKRLGLGVRDAWAAIHHAVHCSVNHRVLHRQPSAVNRSTMG